MARQKTESLPGVPNGKIIKEVSDAAEAYEKVRDQRMKLNEKEEDAHDLLVEVMKKHKLKVYKDDDYEPPMIVRLSVKDPTVKAKVQREKVGVEK